MNSQSKPAGKFYIRTLGCKVNQYESQAMREILVRAGMEESGSKEGADICIVNTCTVTAEAHRQSRQVMGSLHRSNPAAKIVATGCLVEKDAHEVSSLPGVSYIVKNSDKHNIAGIINKQQTTNLPPALSISDFKDRSKAYVKIQDGCENRCSYCKVPLVRKDIVSKSIRDVVAEVSALVEKGFKEIVLTGICLGAWGRDIYPEKIVSSLGLKSAGIADILKAIDALPGDFRVRLSSIEPKYVTDDLIHLMSGGGRVCRHLHIPLQSGDDDILRRMNRPYSSAYYMALIEKLRSSVKDIALTTDILIGFPGETEAHFNNTLEFLKSIAPARTHIFTFSPREGTAAYGMESSLSSGDMEERYRRLSVAASEASYGYRRTFLNRRLDILVETVRDKSTGSLKGYSDNYIKVCFDGPDELMRKIVPVIITAADHTRTAGAYGR